MNVIANQIIAAIKDNQNHKKALWLENYVKHDIQSWGVGIPKIREIVQNVTEINELNTLNLAIQIDVLNSLMENKFTEPKLAAILYIQLYWKSVSSREILNLSTFWLDNQWISDWNVCDWLCVRLLTPVLDKDPELSISFFNDWNKSESIWKSRASLVPFAQSKKIENFRSVILKFSEELIMREDRFCKTAVGWVLRQFSKKDKKFVLQFLDKFQKYTTKEVVKNAAKYIA